MEYCASITEETLAELVAQVGDGVVDTDPVRVRQLSHDMSIRTMKADLVADKPIGLGQVVVSPTTTAQVASLMRWATRHQVPVVPRGLGSGVVGAGVPVKGGVIIDLAGLADVSEVDPINRTVTVGAGKNLGDLDNELKPLGLSLGHYPQSLYLTSVGGAIVMKGSGTFSSLYGDIEDRVGELEFVLPTGEVVQTHAMPRSATGPDLRQLLIGSEGMYGVITHVTLKLVPVPADRRFASVGFDNFQAALDTCREILLTGVRPAVVRIYDPVESAAGHAKFAATPGWLLILAFDGDARLTEIQEQIALDIAASHGGESLGPQPGIHWEQRRFNWSWATDYDEQVGGIADSIEVTASWTQLNELYERCKAAIAPSIMSQFMAHVSHVYDQGAGIYMIFGGVFADEQTAIDAYDRAWATVMEEALAIGALIGHHHGVGMERAPWVERALGSNALDLLRTVQKSIDPAGIMNPGKWASQA